MTFALATIVVVDHNFAGTGNHHQLTFAVGHIAHGGVKANSAVGLGFHAGGHGRTRCGTADVESPHGQLGARLANGLSRNHAYCLTNVHKTTTAQVAAIAFGTQAKTGGASERSSHFDLIHARGFKFLDAVFVKNVASSHNDRTVFGVNHIVHGCAAQDTVAQRFDDLTAFHNGAHE